MKKHELNSIIKRVTIRGNTTTVDHIEMPFESKQVIIDQDNKWWEDNVPLRKVDPDKGK